MSRSSNFNRKMAMRRRAEKAKKQEEAVASTRQPITRQMVLEAACRVEKKVAFNQHVGALGLALLQAVDQKLDKDPSWAVVA